ncbi:hypothetical protein B0H11DRAFT_2189436 [Mycena galericulata]|nr:hypothetical protein B0H11DRAFT_2189436 [Mycena galericulata]
MLKLKKMRRLISSESTRRNMRPAIGRAGYYQRTQVKRDDASGRNLSVVEDAHSTVEMMRRQTPKRSHQTRCRVLVGGGEAHIGYPSRDASGGQNSPTIGKFALKAKTDQHQAYAMDSSRQLETALFENAYARRPWRRHGDETIRVRDSISMECHPETALSTASARSRHAINACIQIGAGSMASVQLYTFSVLEDLVKIQFIPERISLTRCASEAATAGLGACQVVNDAPCGRGKRKTKLPEGRKGVAAKHDIRVRRSVDRHSDGIRNCLERRKAPWTRMGSGTGRAHGPGENNQMGSSVDFGRCKGNTIIRKQGITVFMHTERGTSKALDAEIKSDHGCQNKNKKKMLNKDFTKMDRCTWRRGLVRVKICFLLCRGELAVKHLGKKKV